jgi:hypothetical protein
VTTTDLEQQVLDVLRTSNGGTRPVTLGDLALRCGADAQAMVRCARQLVEMGLAEPAIVVVYGVPTLHGLMPQPEAAREAPRIG